MKALVLAAGSGKRLSELTKSKNKCMLKYRGKPVLEALFDNLSQVDAIDEIIVVVGHRAEDIINYFGNRFANKRIKYVIQKEQKGLVHAIESAKEQIGGDDFFLALGDEIMVNVRRDEMIENFYRNDYAACLGAVRVENTELIKKTYTFIFDERNLVYRLIEKPFKPLNHLMGTGNVIFKGSVFDYIDSVPIHPVRGEKELPDMLQVLIDNGEKVGWFAVCDDYNNLNTLEDIERLHSMEVINLERRNVEKKGMYQSVRLLLVPSEKMYSMDLNMPPLAIGILQGYLRDRGYQVDSIDLNVRLKRKISIIKKERWMVLYQKNIILDYLLDGKLDHEIEALIGELLCDSDVEQADVIGISMGANFSFFEIHFALVIGKYLQERWDKPVVFGGDNLQYLCQFQEEFADLWKGIQANFTYLFVGPGERSMAGLMEWLNDPATKTPYGELPGAIRLDNNQIVYNSQDTPTLFRPDFRGLELEAYSVCINSSEPRTESMRLNLVHYYKWSFKDSLTASAMNRKKLAQCDRKETLIIPYIFNYNCPYACAFCVQSRPDKPKLASKDALSVVNDLETLASEYQTSFFYFFNNSFNYSLEFTKEFCRLVIERGLEIYWSDCARFNNLTRDLLLLLYKAGCRKLVFGFETGSEKLLKLIDKRLDLEHARNVLKWCREIGIWAELEVIIGLPHEFEEDFQATYTFIDEAINEKLISGFQLNKYFVVPVSLFGRYPEKYGIELVRIRGNYEKLVRKSWEQFIENKQTRNTNFQLFRFNEIQGRSYKQIFKETEAKAGRMERLTQKLDTFSEVMILRLMEIAASRE